MACRDSLTVVMACRDILTVVAPYLTDDPHSEAVASVCSVQTKLIHQLLRIHLHLLIPLVHLVHDLEYTGKQYRKVIKSL